MQNREIRVIQSVQRAIDIIDCFSEHELKLTLPQISARTGLNINTARGTGQHLVGQRLFGAHSGWEFLYAGPCLYP